MSEDWRLLIEAIKSLEQEPNFLKDYLWPIVTGMSSALLGAGIAFWTIKHQEKTQIEKEKLDSGNLLIMKVLQAQGNLIAWKTNYVKEYDVETPEFNNPIQRMLSTPRMAGKSKPIEYKTESIIFISKPAPVVGKSSSWKKIVKFFTNIFTTEHEPEEAQNSNWRNVVRVFSMIENYNELQTIM